MRHAIEIRTWILLAGSLLLWAGGMWAQCTIATATAIPDEGSVTVGFQVSGLTDDLLSSPTQGICGIEIDFMHEYVGDLTIILVSPSGTQVQLVGNVTTAIQNTNLTRWNISFVPCATAPMPDPGFSAVWSNLQSWEALTPYSGSYHPNSGCLEDFNTGSANGVWQLILQDHGEFQLGSLASATLIFCNPDGLDCTPCYANAGTLSPASISLCAGQNFQSSSVMVNFGGPSPPASEYAYEYLLISGNTILQSGTTFSANPAPGSYTLCGLSYALEDAALVGTLLASDDLDILQQSLAAGLFCGDLTADCMEIDVFGLPDTVFIQADLCQGEMVEYRGQTYTMPGQYYQTFDGPGMCDTTVSIRIDPRTLSVTIDPPDTLSCGDTLMLQASGSGASGPLMYAWSTLDGHVIPPLNVADVLVDQAGQYVVQVTDGICDGEQMVDVIAGTGFPEILISGGTLTCLNSTLSLTPVYVPLSSAVEWFGPGGFTSNAPDITVNVPGTYAVHVTDPSGCTASETVEVAIDTLTSPITIGERSRDCLAGWLELEFTTSLPVSTWIWTGPGGFMSTLRRPMISAPGVYAVTVIFPNGCMRSAEFTFDGDFTLPDIFISPLTDTIGCGESVLLTASSMTPGVTYAWAGLLGQGSATPDYLAIEPGLYIASVEASNGCIARDTMRIEEGDDLFDVEVFTDTLDCLSDTAIIGVVAPDADMFKWIGHQGPDSLQASIAATVAGLYTVQITNTMTGCTRMVTVRVHEDRVVPLFDFTRDTITCAEPVAEFQFVPFVEFDYSGVFWELPDMTIVPGPDLMSGLPGVHRLIAVSPNGCQGVRNFTIPVDTIPPILLVNAETLGCLDTATVSANSPDPMAQFSWTGPGIITDMGKEITVDQAGVYTVTAIGGNGCIASEDVLVNSNITLPDIMIRVDPITCLADAMLEAIPGEPGIGFEWFGPDGISLGNTPTLQTGIPGSYILVSTGSNRCERRDTIVLQAPGMPVVSVTADTITCSRPTVSLMAEVEGMAISFFWLNMNGDTLGQLPSLQVEEAGPFQLAVTTTDGCMARDTVQVPFDTLSPTAMILQDGEVACQERDFILDGMGSLPAGVIYEWSTPDGTLPGAIQGVRVPARDTGTYQLIVIHPDNGCRDTATLIVTEAAAGIQDVTLDIRPPSCSGFEDAGLEVTGVLGGTGPFLFSLDGGIFQIVPDYSNLAPGQYLLTVEDATGCRLDTLVSIEDTGQFDVDAGPDIEIYLGESIVLSGMTTLRNQDIANQQWIFGLDTLCQACPDVEISPLETADFIFAVSSHTGCMQTDTIRVFVVEKAKFYIPNIFSPNGDGINDEIRLTVSPGVKRVIRWVIFDRWGNAVYGREDFAGDDPSVYWDGRTSTGAFGNPAVFAYVVEFELINGNREVHYGDITLLR